MKQNTYPNEDLSALIPEEVASFAQTDHGESLFAGALGQFFANLKIRKDVIRFTWLPELLSKKSRFTGRKGGKNLNRSTEV